MTGLSSLFQYTNSLLDSRLSIIAFLGVKQRLCIFLRNFLRKFFCSCRPFNTPDGLQ